MSEDNLPTLRAALHANLPGVDRAQAEEIVNEAHPTCPYSRTAHGNIGVNLTATPTPCLRPTSKSKSA